MNPRYPGPEPADPVAQAAAEWALRHDRGLTAVEQDAFSAWLAADPRHRAAWAEHRWGWDELDRLAGLQTSEHAIPDPDLLQPRRARRAAPWREAVVLSALALIAAAIWWPRPTPTVVLPPAVATAPRSLALIEQRELPDGSVLELNRGAVLTEHFSADVRRVRLDRGEAHFKVAKDASRPFVVEAGGVTVQAVGTAFNVRLESAAVEVLVTEGRVAVASVDVGAKAEEAAIASASGAPPPLLLAAGERTVVSRAPAAPGPQVLPVSGAELEARLAWQPRLLDFTGAPLAEIVGEFNRRNPVRLVIGDPALAELRLSATFRSDNVDGFVRLMESDFGMAAEWKGDAEIWLRRDR